MFRVAGTRGRAFAPLACGTVGGTEGALPAAGKTAVVLAAFPCAGTDLGLTVLLLFAAGFGIGTILGCFTAGLGTFTGRALFVVATWTGRGLEPLACGSGTETLDAPPVTGREDGALRALLTGFLGATLGAEFTAGGIGADACLAALIFACGDFRAAGATG